jgi:hypothetical protein
MKWYKLRLLEVGPRASAYILLSGGREIGSLPCHLPTAIYQEYISNSESTQVHSITRVDSKLCRGVPTRVAKPRPEEHRHTNSASQLPVERIIKRGLIATPLHWNFGFGALGLGKYPEKSRIVRS